MVRLVRLSLALCLYSVAACSTAKADGLPDPWLPLAPGAAECAVGAAGARLSNAAVEFAVENRDGALQPVSLVNHFTSHTQPLTGELFVATLRANRAQRVASQFRLEGPVACSRIEALPGSARAADRRAGQTLQATLVDATSNLRVRWRAVLRDGANYVREEVEIVAPQGADLHSVSMIELDLPGARVLGTASGSPVITEDAFYAFEHPVAEAKTIDGHASMPLRRALPLRAGVPVQYSAVLGVAPEGQLRRGFQAYLENERAAPFRTFLHYNSWYDIGYFTPYTAAEALAVIGKYGEKLVDARGVRMDSFLFDDGWDDTSQLWQFSRDFPSGFAPLRDATAKIGAGPGMWLSPWGGYGPPRQARLATARSAGYEVDDQGLALSGPKYYALFHATAIDLLRRYGINQFKLDGTGSPDKVTPGSDFDSDFAAAIALIGDLRAIKPDLFINLTTGTWPSPFWLRTADSIWRGGEDHSFAGVGTDRQRWITYRDADTYGGVVRVGPLFPLNSLMLHGIIYARKAQGLNTDPGNDFADEVRSYFASGTGLQEMYVSPDLLSDKNWDELATAAKWARTNAAVLRDSHWIGGDPARGDVYGWAGWVPGRAFIALRNPTASPRRFDLDVGAALELPAGQPTTWMATPAYLAPGQSVQRWSAGQAVTLTLRPFEVLVWNLAAKAGE